MSNPDTIPTPAPTATPETAAVAQAGATAVSQNQNINQIDVHVTVQAPRGGGGGRSARKPSSAGVASGEKEHGTNEARQPGIAASKPPVLSQGWLPRNFGQQRGDGVTHHDDQDRGKARHTLTDRDGSTVVVVRDPETGDYSIAFNDKRVQFTTSSDEPGFDGKRRHPRGYGGSKSLRMDVSAGGMFSNATIYCEDNVPALSWAGVDRDTARTSNKVVDAVTVQEIQSFMKRNPELAAELKRMNVPLTEVGGESVNAAELNKLRPKLQACPTGRDGDYLARVNRP